MSDRHTQSMRNKKIDDLRRWVSIAVVILLAGILLSYRNLIAGWLVYSFSYLVWSFNLFGRVVPPQGIWIALIILVLYVAVGSFYGKRSREAQSQIDASPVTGPVEAMADWIEERRRGVYFKWRIANLLGRVHQAQYENSAGRMQLPAEDVKSFLDAGLNASYMDFPTPGMLQKSEPTVLDIDLEPVLDYLEDEMEIRT